MFKAQLKSARLESGLSQKELATMLFVSQQAVAGWESGRTTPNPEVIVKIAETLGVSTDYLLGHTDQKEKKPAPEEGLALEKKQVGELLDTLSDDQIQIALSFLKYLSAEQNAKKKKAVASESDNSPDK